MLSSNLASLGDRPGFSSKQEIRYKYLVFLVTVAGSALLFLR
jgi:hypothetical protein